MVTSVIGFACWAGLLYMVNGWCATVSTSSFSCTMTPWPHCLRKPWTMTKWWRGKKLRYLSFREQLSSWFQHFQLQQRDLWRSFFQVYQMLCTKIKWKGLTDSGKLVLQKKLHTNLIPNNQYQTILIVDTGIGITRTTYQLPCYYHQIWGQGIHDNFPGWGRHLCDWSVWCCFFILYIWLMRKWPQSPNIMIIWIKCLGFFWRMVNYS